MEEKKTNSKLISVGVLVAVVILVVIVAAIDKRDNKVTANSVQSNTSTLGTETTTPTPATTATPSATTNTSAYNAGTYNASGSYETPQSTETISVSLTISSDGTITASSISQDPQERDSAAYQSRFANGYKSQVIGKNIASLRLGNISGSSLTPIGFNEALSSIFNQSKV